MSQTPQQRQHTFRNFINALPMTERLYEYLRQAVDRAASMYPDEVPATLANIIDRSFMNLAFHSVSDFIEYGDYRALDAIVRQVETDQHYGVKSRPHIVVLYGPPGTGKTTWVRNAVARHLCRNFKYIGKMLDGIYLEVTPGDFSSKFAGVPVALLKTLINVVSTDKFPSVILFDEADGFLLKPQGASGGIEIEQHRLVAELKASLGVLLSTNYPVVIAMTTNYKDAIAKADPAIGDRVTSWIEVPHPPLHVREAMAAKLLPPVFRNAWEGILPVAQANVLRALRSGAEPPILNPARTRHPMLQFRMPWIAPALPFEADYLIGYLIAWGWNPLDNSIIPSLELDFFKAIALWDDNNPIFKVYARGMISELEMLRRYNEENHGVGKSFLRSFYLLKRGVDDFEKVLTLVYPFLWDNYLSVYREKLLGNELEEDLLHRKNMLVKSLMLHGVPPSLLHHAISRQSSSGEFIRMINQVLVTAAMTTNAIRQIYLPYLISYLEDPLERFSDLRHRIGAYNKLVVKELIRGRLLEPMRILLTEKDLEKAWSEALKSFNSLDSDMKPYVGVTMIAPRLLHKAIHTAGSEARGEILYNIYKDGYFLIEAVPKIADELGIREWLPVVLDLDSFPYGGITVFNEDDWRILDSTLFNSNIASNYYLTDTYTIASVVNYLGHYIVNIILDIREELKKKEKTPITS